MPAFHLLRCVVSLGGDQGTQVYRDRTRPIVFPELPILQFMHGEEAVTDVHVVGTWEAPNDEVLTRLQTIYAPETLQAVFPGARPRLPLSDPSIPRCSLPVYKPRVTRPANPDPKLRPLDQFTVTSEMPVLDAPPLPVESDPTPDEIAAHAQDDEDDMGLGPVVPGVVPDLPRPEELPHIVRDTLGRGSSHHAAASTLPDVNAGGSHPPGHADNRKITTQSAAREVQRRG
jgi:hypothetical protein